MSTLALLFCLAAQQAESELPPLGTNLAPWEESSTQWPLVNVFKIAKPWASSNGDPLDVDEQGNVKSLRAGQTAVTVIYSSGHYPKGTYTMSWVGKGEFETTGSDKLTPDGEGRARVEVGSETGITIALKSVDPKDPPRELSLVMPGYEETASTEPFHPVFLQRMSLYRVLRFANWQSTKSIVEVKWADRATLADAMYTQGKGVPLELQIDLANTKSSWPWFSVPVQANDEYIKQMATLLKDRLAGHLKVVIEYGDEGWASPYVLKQGGNKFYSQRAQQVFTIFETVFGGKSRLVRVLSGPFTDSKACEDILAAGRADTLAVAPMFGQNSPAGTLDDFFGALKTEVAGPVRDRMFELAGIAERRGMRLITYSGGQEPSSVSKMPTDAAADQRLADTYISFLKTWRSSGGMLFVNSQDCGPYGAIQYQDQDPQTSMKNRAMIQYALFPDR